MAKREEIEARLKEMSDFLKMEYLEGLLKKGPSMDEKKFVCQTLGELYANRNMYTEAARNMDRAAEAAIPVREKVECYMREIEFLIRAGSYMVVDEVLRKTLALSNTQQKFEIKHAVKEMYLKQANQYEKEKRRANALKIYEITVNLVDNDSSAKAEGNQEKRQMMEKLLSLYDTLGKIREGTILREKLSKL